MEYDTKNLTWEERLLLAFARDPNETEVGATASYTIDNCLDYARHTIDGFDGWIRGRTVLDYGCGPGWQSVAMRTKCGAERVFGLDVVPDWFQRGAELAEANGCAERVSFGPQIPAELAGQFDVVLSLSAFEHYADPASELTKMRRQLKPGGIILISWAEPWYSHSGSHFNNYTRVPGTNYPLPWLNLFFSDRAMLTLRTRFRADRPAKIEDISGGLNRMTVARFERIIKDSGMTIRQLQLFSTKNLPLVTRVPVLRELLTSSVSCVLQPGSAASPQG